MLSLERMTKDLLATYGLEEAKSLSGCSTLASSPPGWGELLDQDKYPCSRLPMSHYLAWSRSSPPSLASLTLVLSGTARGLASAKPYVARRLLVILCWLSVSVRACLSHAMVMPGTHGPHLSHARQRRTGWRWPPKSHPSGDLPTIRMSSTYTSRKSGLPMSALQTALGQRQRLQSRNSPAPV